MPKVSEQHMEERRAQIVSAALRCFRARGIAETTMRDIFAESGLSAGAVYNHFPSKHELIEFLARESEKKWLDMVSACEAQPGLRPAEKLEGLVISMIEGLGRPDVVADIASDIGIWAFSIHKAPLRSVCRSVFETVARGLDRILAGSEGPDTSGGRSSAGAHLLAHLQGLALQAAMGMPIDLEREEDRVRAIIHRLDEES